MASFKTGKLEVFKSNKILLVLGITLVVCVWLVGMVLEVLSVVPQNNVTAIQNFKLIDGIDPLTAILKQGDELLIKDTNGQFKRIKEIKIEDGFKIPQAIFEQINKLESIKLEQMSNPNFKCPIDVQEMNKNLIEHIELLHRQNIAQSQIKQDKESVINDGLLDEQQPDLIRRYCEDPDIEQLIVDSVVDETVDTELRQPNCNLIKTESYLHKNMRSSNSKTKYLFIYICIAFPLFIVYYFQNKKYKNRSNYVNSSNNTCLFDSSS